MSSPGPKKRTSGPRLAAATLVSIALSLACGELALRAYHHFIGSFVFYSDSYNRYRAKPHGSDWDFNLNSLGFKDEEFGEKREGVYRILGIGDSFAYGIVPYEFNYLTLLDQNLDTEDEEVEVLNMGIPGIQPNHYYNLLAREGVSLNPDLVLLSFFIGNDFDEEHDAPPERRFYISTLIHYLFTVAKGIESGSVYNNGEYCDHCPNFDEETYLQIESIRLEICLEPNPAFQAKLDATMVHIEKIARLCQQIGSGLLIAIIPDEGQVNRDLQKQVIDTYRENGDNRYFNEELPNKALASKLEELGVDYIDLHTHFENSGDAYYRVRDSHWNIPGNSLAAKHIRSAVIRKMREESTL